MLFLWLLFLWEKVFTAELETGMRLSRKPKESKETICRKHQVINYLAKRNSHMK